MTLAEKTFGAGKGPGFPTGEAREGHFGSVGAEWRTEFARKNRTESYIQGLATTHHAEVRKLHLSFSLTQKSPSLYTTPT